MYISESITTGSNGVLHIGGCDAVKLAEKYGTPLYVMDEALIRKNCREYRKNAGENSLVCYASKAFSCREIYRIIDSEGLGADVVSGGELFTALSAGFPAEKICFHGSAKTQEELKYAVESGVGYIAVDSFDELARLSDIASTLGKTAGVLIRLTPGVDPHTHKAIITGNTDSKFGFGISSGATEACLRAASAPALRFLGVHCHIGSQIFEYDAFDQALFIMCRFIAELRGKGVETEVLNIGGGIGIRYTQNDGHVSLGDYMRHMSSLLRKTCEQYGMPVPKLMAEPGRSIVGSAGTTLYSVNTVKRIPGATNYVSVDGGMTDNPRFMLYGSKYEVYIADRPEAEADALYTIAGRTCESGDIVACDVALPRPKAGDILAVLCTGAYNYSMSSNYNRLPRPAVVMVNSGADRLAVRRETYDDIAGCDI